MSPESYRKTQTIFDGVSKKLLEKTGNSWKSPEMIKNDHLINLIVKEDHQKSPESIGRF